MGFVLTEVTHDGHTLIDHRHCAAAGRSPPLGLSLVWLCSLRPWCGASDYSPRAAPHWPTLKGRNRSPALPWVVTRRRPLIHLTQTPFSMFRSLIVREEQAPWVF